VSAFANGIGGTLFFGIDDDNNVVGLADAQDDAEYISARIKERISPIPEYFAHAGTVLIKGLYLTTRWMTKNLKAI